MTAPVDDSAHPQMKLPAVATTRLTVVLGGALLALSLTRLSPAIELDSWLALAAWAVSFSGGWWGVPVVGICSVRFFSFNFNKFISKTRRAWRTE